MKSRLSDPVGSDQFRAVLREVASPVVVVTAHSPDGPRGATVGSFTSVSLSPPVVSFNLTKGTRLHSAVRSLGTWAVHLLAPTQSEIADHFAQPYLTCAQQFGAYSHSTDGLFPVLLDSVAVLGCATHSSLDVADHTIFVGEVRSLLERGRRAGLLYHRQRYTQVQGTD